IVARGSLNGLPVYPLPAFERSPSHANKHRVVTISPSRRRIAHYVVVTKWVAGYAFGNDSGRLKFAFAVACAGRCGYIGHVHSFPPRPALRTLVGAIFSQARVTSRAAMQASICRSISSSTQATACSPIGTARGNAPVFIFSYALDLLSP